jgi:adenylate cyclase
MFRTFKETLKPGDKRLILLAVDEDTGRKYGFPLPRAAYATALDKLKDLGVAAAVCDVMFFEPREGDAALAAATKRFGRVVHLYAFTDGLALDKASLPVSPVLRAGRYFGAPNVDYLQSADDHVRSYQLFRGVPDPFGGRTGAPSVAAAALAAYDGGTLEDVLARYGGGLRVINLRRPVEWERHEGGPSGNGRLVSPFRRISMLDLLDGALSRAQREALRGAIVVIGSTASGYSDRFSTALGDVPGSELHLQAIDNSLNGDPMSAANPLFAIFGIVAAVLLTYWLQTLPIALGASAAAASFLGWVAFAFWMFRRGVIVEFVPPAFVFVSSFLVLVAHRALSEDAEKRRIKSLFGQFVAPEVVADLAADPERVKLGGEKRELTILFLDIAHFTNISEKMTPEELIQFLNRYLSALSDVIFEHHGTIDKYIGDCIMAFWNAPVPNGDHRADAIRAALDCQRAVGELNKDCGALPQIPAVRIGISSGLATVGLTGTQKKLQYTAIGDEVNLASRLEGANKFFGSRILVNEATLRGAENRVVARCLGRVRVVGKETPIRVYEPIAEKGKLPEGWQKGLPVYEKALALFEARSYAEALKAFEEFLKIVPDDGPGLFYRSRSAERAAAPSDEPWDGVFSLTAK